MDDFIPLRRILNVSVAVHAEVKALCFRYDVQLFHNERADGVYLRNENNPIRRYLTVLCRTISAGA